MKFMRFLMVAAFCLTASNAFAQNQCAGGEIPCGSSCYKPSSGAKCIRGTVCGFGEDLCGGECYSTAPPKTCFTGLPANIYPPSGTIVCLGSEQPCNGGCAPAGTCRR